jgi:glycosidase
METLAAVRPQVLALLPRQLHISRAARERYGLDAALFGFTGRAIVADFPTAHALALKLNQGRGDNFVRAGELNALGLMHEISHRVLQAFRQQKSPDLWPRTLQVLASTLGPENFDATLETFVREFPPLPVFRGESTPAKYLHGQSNGVSHRELTLEELLLLHLSNINPAAANLRELFDDSVLASTSYAPAMRVLREELRAMDAFGPQGQDLFALLCAPFQAEPSSLSAQLRWMRANWGQELVGDLFKRLLGGIDMAAEEEKPMFFGPGPALVPDYRRARLRSEVEQEEPEAFSDDRAWMPSAVMLAKNAYVWMEQLCRKYSAPIHTLDQIPDEELDELQAHGFTGLWLIGLWERSTASKEIKRLCGNADADASAYSLKRYEIADDLGGWSALEDLRERALKRGIRMASDMVPNHMGIDSDWVVNHPDWFVSMDKPPFPTYTFQGRNLSPEPHIGIFLEDHYYSQDDAAVVFQRIDYATNDVRYIYHGNDGTLMPWNDTAQLDYLKAEVREAVIQTILHVARNFPIIRFDAAMTLAKRHFQRLWFPEPGTGGDIPSRSWFGLTMDEFDAMMPVEFWREVVDRVAAEAPDTLLLAEAFWMMESYFVRSLGMHRVYNSAFMNMMRDEKNEEYRLVLKNTLEFDPDILQRFVNFQNNPDEKTAIEQFGDGDKYFGVATLMSTLPGLPMFGHGQVEGFQEKYGMEYRSAKWHEKPNEGLVQRHKREIFPLLHERDVFAGVDNFVLFDFYRQDGSVDENVFAYSNRKGEKKALVVFHNLFADTRGTLHHSAAAFDKATRELKQKTLKDALELSGEDGKYLRMRDLASGNEFLFRSRDWCERGVEISLRAYERRVWVEIEEFAGGHEWAVLCDELAGSGVPSLKDALRERELSVVLEGFGQWFDAALIRRLVPAPCFSVAKPGAPGAPSTPGAAIESPSLDFAALEEWQARALEFFERLDDEAKLSIAPGTLSANARDRLVRLWQVHSAAPESTGSEQNLRDRLSDCATWCLLLSWCALKDLPRALATEGRGTQAQVLEGGSEEPQVLEGGQVRPSEALDAWVLGPRLKAAWAQMGLDEGAGEFCLDSLRALLDVGAALFARGEREGALESVFAHESAARVVGVNRHRGALWFNREAWEEWTARAALAHALDAPLDADASPALARALAAWSRWSEEALSANYSVEAMLKSENSNVPQI